MMKIVYSFYFITEVGTNTATSPLFLIISLTILELINEVSALVSRNIVSIPDNFLFVCAIAFSNSKSAGFRRPLKINSALILLQYSTVNPE